VPFRIEPRDLAHVTRTHHELMADDQLADRQRLLRGQTDTFDCVSGAAHLADEIVDRDVGTVLDEVLGKRGPVRVGLTATRQCVRVRTAGRTRQRRLGHGIAPEE